MQNGERRSVQRAALLLVLGSLGSHSERTVGGSSAQLDDGAACSRQGNESILILIEGRNCADQSRPNEKPP
jgi:hypothetical protein